MSFEFNDLPKMLCVFCSAEFTPKMIAKYNCSMWSEWTWIYNECLNIKIECEKCKRIVYDKNGY